MLQCQFRNVLMGFSMTKFQYDDLTTSHKELCARFPKDKYQAIIEKCKEAIDENYKKLTTQFTKPVQTRNDDEQIKQLGHCLTLLCLNDDEIKVTYMENMTRESYKSAAKTMSKLCKCCKKEDSNKRCGGCGLAYYCSTECQKAHWNEHKKVCCCNRK